MSTCAHNPKMKLVQGLDAYIYQYVYPIQFLVTVVGNCLIISVLLSSQKNRANHLLSFLALCDLLVLISMLPYFFASFDQLSLNITFRILFNQSKAYIAAFSNWFSAAAIWFVLAVSIERLLIIKFPFRSLNNYNYRHIIFTATVIILTTLFLTSYHLVSMTCFELPACNATSVYPICLPNTQDALFHQFRRNNTYSDFTKLYIHISTYLNAIFSVIIPIFAVTLINISLIRLLKKRNSQDLIANSVMNPSQLVDQERRMTSTVIAIITCFSLTQGPSAILYLYDTITAHSDRTSMFTTISCITNSLVLTGKMLNVVLFCMTSSTFRRKLFLTLRLWCGTMYYCDKKQAILRSRSMSRSVLTQKTSLAHSPSLKIIPRRLSQLSRIESFNMTKLNKSDTKQSLLLNTTREC